MKSYCRDTKMLKENYQYNKIKSQILKTNFLKHKIASLSCQVLITVKKDEIFYI